MKVLSASDWLCEPSKTNHSAATTRLPARARNNGLGILATLIVGCLHSISASALSLNISPLLLVGTAGSSVTFTGSITNDIAQPLNTGTDLFQNFSGYDPGVLSPDDLLILSNLTLNPGDTSPVINLFSVAIDPSAVPGIYDAQVSIQDYIDLEDASPYYTVQVQVIPEPSGLSLVVGALPLLSGSLRKKPSSAARA